MKPIPLFYSYSHKDEQLLEQLKTHLSLLKREGIISDWHDHKISAGTEWENQIDRHIELAQIILLMISADFLASDYCYDTEMMRVMERHEDEEVRVIPVVLRPCDWWDAPFGKLQALPKDAKPVTTWSKRDKAWLDVVQGIRRACQEIQQVQTPGIQIYCEEPPAYDRGRLVWPRCAVRLPDAPELSYDITYRATTYELSWGESRMIPLKPQIEYTIIAYTTIPLNGNVGLAKIKCTVKENEVVQYFYRILERLENEEIKGQLIQIAYL
jgi:hypothetical protein